MMGDLPTMTKSAHSSSTYSLAQPTFLGNTVARAMQTLETPPEEQFAGFGQQGLIMNRRAKEIAAMPIIKKEKPMPTQARRLVQVFIADPDEKVPLEQSLLYTGSQKLTDLTDQELFFEIDIKSILKTHNAARTKIIDKSVKDRTEFLEPAKVRDLKMVVVDVASF